MAASKLTSRCATRPRGATKRRARIDDGSKQEALRAREIDLEMVVTRLREDVAGSWSSHPGTWDEMWRRNHGRRLTAPNGTSRGIRASVRRAGAK